MQNGTAPHADSEVIAPACRAGAIKATLEAIKYAPGSLELLDQRLLPMQTVFLPVPTTAVAYDHIKDMVRMQDEQLDDLDEARAHPPPSVGVGGLELLP